MDEKTRNTLFIRNLPYNITNEKLEGLFSDIGPIKSCFVVKDKETGKCRGFGFVKYSLREDAEKAKSEITSIDGRKLLIHFATKKPKTKNKRKRVPLDEDDSESEDKPAEKVEDESVDKGNGTSEDAGVKCPGTLAKEKHKAACMVIIKNFGPKSFNEHVKSVLTSQKNMRKVVYPVQGRENNVAAIIMKSKRDALKAAKQIDKMKISGHQISAELLSVERAVSKEARQSKKSRLIVRNLAFACNEDKLKKAFAAFGEITDVVIPKKSGGKMLGFGFVQFTTVDGAKKAIAEMNAKTLLGRPIAVDWTVPKNKYEEFNQVASDTDDDDDDDKTSTPINKGQAKKVNRKKASPTVDKSEESTKESDTDLESASECGSDYESEEEQCSETENVTQSEDGSSSGNDSEIMNDDRKDEVKKFVKKSDVDQGRTLFIRNLSYDTEEEDLQALFEEFGQLNYCRIVTDPQTDHSRGTAFVQFKNKPDVEKALEAADPEKGPGVIIDGRKLNILRALPRDRVVRLKENLKKKEEKITEIFISQEKEVMIRPGTKAAEGLTPADLNKRMKIDALKRQKLKNPNIFISPTRLCIRNIPLLVGDKDLTKAMLNAVDDKSAKITECRIMRDLTRVNTSGIARSRGYAFVEFGDHKHALKALHATNNNADILGGNRRLIVEFSLENRAALVAKQKRQDRSKIKMEILSKSKNTFVDVKTRKRNRDKRKQNSTMDLSNVDEEGEDDTGPAKKRIKGLPSHWGPKVRHRKRNQDVKVAKKQKDKKARTYECDRQLNHKRDSLGDAVAKKKRRKPDVTDNLDKLINKYRQQFSKDINKAKRPGHKSKWFE